MASSRAFVALLFAFALIAAVDPAARSTQPISGPRWQSHPAIDPTTGDVWFVDSNEKFEGWQLRIARCRSGRLEREQSSPISAAGLEADPFFVRDGSRLYFISSRLTGGLRSTDLDIWMTTRSPSGSWSPPVRLPDPVNSNSAEWFPRPASNGWIYFGSNRPGGLGGNDIWRARAVGKKWRLENLGASVNSSDNEYEFEPAPDGLSALLATDKGIFRLKRSGNSWSGKVRLGTSVNVNGTEIGPTILDRHGTAFLLSRDIGKGLSGELIQMAPSGTASAGPALTSTCKAKASSPGMR
jgi:hypothetical protein